MRRLRFLPLALLAASCPGRTRESPVPGPVEGTVVAQYRIESAGRTLGYLVEVSFPDPAPRRYFRVQNAKFQDAGFVTANGVAFRYEPHRASPLRVATDTMERNVAAILDADGPVSLIRLDPGP